jgi:dienelactone hydrolase
MSNAVLVCAAAMILCGVTPLSVAQIGSFAPSIPPVDAPELAHVGPFPIGTKVNLVALPATPTLTGPGNWIVAPRTVSVRLWYPAKSMRLVSPIRYSHTMNARGSRPVKLVTPGIATSNAVPHGGRFPLVLMSHGFRGWSESMSYLGENLASKGYVVAAIDHGDPTRNDPGTLALSFGNVLLQRATDQSAVLRSLLRQSDAVASMIDPGRIGLIGYSMGGYGALTTAGAAYDSASPTFQQLPAALRTKLFAQLPDDTIAARIGALVTIAPWGGQPTARAWTAASLARIKAPLMMIDGEDDDVVDYRHGVRWIYGATTGSNRWLLTYEAARHNVGNNAPPANLPDFGAGESQAEPVWRGDRLNAINVHFITAFLDLTLKNERTRAAYLMVPTVRAVDSVWPEPIGPAGSGAIAGDAQPMHWRGFQRRWAIGLRLTHQAGNALSVQVNKGEAEEQQRD